ncbi:MAG: hypothetical protein UEJ45_05085 [Peptococcaceae bacterium]|nr:hypothetical protein [Peptococcaceae bacterium]
MKAMKYIIALVLSGVACWLNAAMNDWTLLRTFMIAPINAYSVKVAMLAILILLVGYCCGIGFQKKAETTKIFVTVFLVIMIVHLIVPVLGGSVVSSMGETMLVVYANMGLVTYLSALLAGLSLGSERQKPQ